MPNRLCYSDNEIYMNTFKQCNRTRFSRSVLLQPNVFDRKVENPNLLIVAMYFSTMHSNDTTILLEDREYCRVAYGTKIVRNKRRRIVKIANTVRNRIV